MLNCFRRYWCVNNFNPKCIKHLEIHRWNRFTAEHPQEKECFLLDCVKNMKRLETIKIHQSCSLINKVIDIVYRIPELNLSKIYIEAFYSGFDRYRKEPIRYPKAKDIYIDFSDHSFESSPSQARLNEEIIDFLMHNVLQRCCNLYIGYKKTKLLKNGIFFIKKLIKILGIHIKKLYTVNKITLNYPMNEYFNQGVGRLLFNLIDVCKKRNILVILDRNATSYLVKPGCLDLNHYFIHFYVNRN